MAEPLLSIRSAQAYKLAHRLARRDGRSSADIVGRALGAYREARLESPVAFYVRPTNESGADLELDAAICENQKINFGSDLQ